MLASQRCRGRAAAFPCLQASASQPSSSALAPQQSPATKLSSIVLFACGNSAPLLERREKQENCLPSDLSAARPCYQAISLPAAASSLASAGWAPAVPDLGGLATALLPFSAALQAAA